MEFEKVFVTGSDKNNEWMLDWFLTNFKMHNSTPIIFADFGVSDSMKKWVTEYFDKVIDMPKPSKTAWFLKPKTMIEVSKISNHVCWIDTDCHVLKPIDDIFKYTTHNKLSMVRDEPWTNRFKTTWHNSGIVAFKGCPKILKDWEETARSSNERGDQEVLHSMLSGDELRRRIYIEDIPNVYNWLRLQIIDNQDTVNKKVMHWTGKKGNDVIKEMIKNGR